MASNLYEELGIPKNAPQDQIRKAYKKRALQTHPDRLPPGATPEQKAEADERFRRVNNAYEVLSDTKKRNEYDLHGVWPPPEEEEDPFPSRMPGGSRFPRAHPSRSRTSFPSDPFAFHRSAFRGFQFTDPYDLFDSLFANAFPPHTHAHPTNVHIHTHTHGTPPRTRHGSYPPQGPVNPFEHMQRMQAEIESFMDDIDRDPFGAGFPRMGPMMAMPLPPTHMGGMGAMGGMGGGGRGGRQWVSDSYVTSTVNGVTQTIHKRVDSEGNEHITRTLPDGQKLRTINGIEQPPPINTGYLPAPSKTRRSPTSPVDPSGPVYRRKDYDHEYDYGAPPAHTPPPSYHEHAPPVDNTSGGYRRSRRSPDKYAYASQPPISPNPDNNLNNSRERSHGVVEDRDRQQHHRDKKRWWQH